MNTIFDEDAFGEAFLKCYEKFGDSEITFDTAIKYFWTVYINTVKSTFINNSKHEMIPIDTMEDFIDENTNQYAVDIFNKAMDKVEEEFGEESMIVYSLYKYYNWSINDIEAAGYDCTDISNRIKTIHKFVKKYCKELKKSL